MNITSEILIILAVILINGILAMSEMAVAASRKARLQQRENEGDKQAGRVLKLLEDPNLFLSTVQIGITLVGVFTGAIGGATLAEPLSVSLEKIPIVASIADSLALGIVVICITFFSILLGELVPKRIALHSPEQIASFFVGPMIVISKLFNPLVWLLGKLSNFTLNILGIKPGNEPPVTEEEIQLLIDQGTQAGVFEESEQDMVEGVLSLGDQRVYSLMTPRTDIVWLDIGDTMDEIRAKIAELAKDSAIVFGDPNASPFNEKGAFLSPILFRCERPWDAKAVHDVEAFGPVSTLMPYKDGADAIALANRGKGSLVMSVFTYDTDFAESVTLGAGAFHGRIYVGVVKDDERGVAAELEADLLHRPCGLGI